MKLYKIKSIHLSKPCVSTHLLIGTCWGCGLWVAALGGGRRAVWEAATPFAAQRLPHAAWPWHFPLLSDVNKAREWMWELRMRRKKVKKCKQKRGSGGSHLINITLLFFSLNLEKTSHLPTSVPLVSRIWGGPDHRPWPAGPLLNPQQHYPASEGVAERVRLCGGTYFWEGKTKGD